MLNQKISFLNKISKVWHFLITWSYLLCFLFPIIGYFLVINYFTPDPFNILFPISCQEDNCQAILDKSSIDEIYSLPTDNFQTQLDQVNRLDQFSKPFSGFIRLIPRVTNKSTFVISVSNPKADFLQQATIICELPFSDNNIFPFNSVLPFDQKNTFLSTPDAKRRITDDIVNCTRRIQTSTDLTVTVGPKGIVLFKDVEMNFKIEFFPDKESKILIMLEMFVIFLVFLPILREGIRFISKGWNYFSNKAK